MYILSIIQNLRIKFWLIIISFEKKHVIKGSPERTRLVNIIDIEVTGSV